MKINSFVPDTQVFDNINTNCVLDSDKVQDTDNSSSNSFESLLKEKLDEVNNSQLNSEKASEQYVSGESTDISQVMIAGEEAKLSLQTAVQVRNKLLDAYQELIKVQI